MVASGKGGSVYMTFVNSKLKAARGTKGRRRTRQEISDVRAEAAALWEGMSDEENAVYAALYDAQVGRRRRGEPRDGRSLQMAGIDHKFVPRLGVGTPSLRCRLF